MDILHVITIALLVIMGAIQIKRKSYRWALTDYLLAILGCLIIISG